MNAEPDGKKSGRPVDSNKEVAQDVQTADPHLKREYFRPAEPSQVLFDFTGYSNWTKSGSGIIVVRCYLENEGRTGSCAERRASWVESDATGAERDYEGERGRQLGSKARTKIAWNYCRAKTLFCLFDFSIKGHFLLVNAKKQTKKPLLNEDSESFLINPRWDS